MSKKGVIREFKRSDLSRIAEIERKSFRNPWSINLFEFFSKSFPQGFLIAEVDSKVVGYLIAVLETKLDFRKLSIVKYGHILNLAVDEKYRRRGIAYSLLEEILRILRENGASKVYLEVRASNLAAIKLYSKLNFKVEKVLRAYYPDNEDAYLMSKNLQG